MRDVFYFSANIQPRSGLTEWLDGLKWGIIKHSAHPLCKRFSRNITNLALVEGGGFSLDDV